MKMKMKNGQKKKKKKKLDPFLFFFFVWPLKKRFNSDRPLNSLSSFSIVSSQTHNRPTSCTIMHPHTHTHTLTAINSLRRVCLQMHHIYLSLFLSAPYISFPPSFSPYLTRLSSPLSARILINLLFLLPPISSFYSYTSSYSPHKFSLLQFFVLISRHDSQTSPSFSFFSSLFHPSIPSLSRASFYLESVHGCFPYFLLPSL